MRSLLSLIALLLLTTPFALKAQELDDELKADLDAIEFGTIDQVAAEFKPEKKILRKNKLRWYRETPWSPAPFRVVIQKGTLIENMEGEERFVAPRDITAWVKMPYTSSIYCSILGKDGKPLYRVRSEKIVDIEQIVDMTPKIDPTESYENKPLFAAVDKTLSIKSILSFGTHTGDAAFFANLFGGESTGAKASRTSFKTFFALELPVHFGVGASIENGSWNNQQDGLPVAWDMISVGPAFRLPLGKGETFEWSAELSIERSLSASATLNEGSQIDLEVTTFELRAEMALPTKYGTFALFGGYQRQELAAKDGPEDVLYYSSETGSNQSGFFGLNYQFGWQL